MNQSINKLSTKQIRAMAEIYIKQNGISHYHIIEGKMAYTKPDMAFYQNIDFNDLNIAMGVLERWEDIDDYREFVVHRVRGVYEIILSMHDGEDDNIITSTGDTLPIAIAEALIMAFCLADKEK